MMGDTHRETMLEMELEKLKAEYSELARDFYEVCKQRNSLRERVRKLEIEKLTGEDDGR